jgi:hypothetical protein
MGFVNSNAPSVLGFRIEAAAGERSRDGRRGKAASEPVRSTERGVSIGVCQSGFSRAAVGSSSPLDSERSGPAEAPLLLLPRRPDKPANR